MVRNRRRTLLGVVLGLCLIYSVWLGYSWHNCQVIHWMPETREAQSLEAAMKEDLRDETDLDKQMMKKRLWNKTLARSAKPFSYWLTSPDEAESLYHVRLTRLEAICPSLESVGKLDGVKHVCMVQKFHLIKPCLVYSFGIAQDFTFEDELVNMYQCRVYAFDPSTGIASHERRPGLKFFNVGLGEKDIEEFTPQRDVYVKNGEVWKMRRLARLLKEHGHLDHIIDILKLDIEGHEFGALATALEDGSLVNVKQIIVEFHVFGEAERKLYMEKLAVVVGLHKAGFRIFYSRNHLCPLECGALCATSYCHQVDLGLININFFLTKQQ